VTLHVPPANGLSRSVRVTAAIDLADTHVANAGGMRIAALGGLWQMAVFGFAGLSLLSDGVSRELRHDGVFQVVADKPHPTGAS